MPQHVRMKRTESGAPGSGTNEVVDRLPGHRLPTLRHKQPRQGVVTCMQVTLDCPQFVAGDRMFDRQAILESPNPHPGAFEVQVLAPHTDGFADAQAVAKHHEQDQKIPHAMAAFLACLKESVHFAVAQEVAGALMLVRQPDILTFYILPLGNDIAPPLGAA